MTPLASDFSPRNQRSWARTLKRPRRSRGVGDKRVEILEVGGRRLIIAAEIVEKESGFGVERARGLSSVRSRVNRREVEQSAEPNRARRAAGRPRFPWGGSSPGRGKSVGRSGRLAVDHRRRQRGLQQAPGRAGQNAQPFFAGVFIGDQERGLLGLRVVDGRRRSVRLGEPNRTATN